MSVLWCSPCVFTSDGHGARGACGCCCIHTYRVQRYQRSSWYLDVAAPAASQTGAKEDRIEKTEESGYQSRQKARFPDALDASAYSRDSVNSVLSEHQLDSTTGSVWKQTA